MRRSGGTSWSEIDKVGARSTCPAFHPSPAPTLISSSFSCSQVPTAQEGLANPTPSQSRVFVSGKRTIDNCSRVIPRGDITSECAGGRSTARSYAGFPRTPTLWCRVAWPWAEPAARQRRRQSCKQQIGDDEPSKPSSADKRRCRRIV